MKFYLDEHFSPTIAVALRELGIDAISAEDWENKGLSDEEVLEFCANRGCHLITQDVKDFAPLAKEWIDAGRTFSTIIFVPKSYPSNKPKLLIRAIESLIHDVQSREHFVDENTTFHL